MNNYKLTLDLTLDELVQLQCALQNYIKDTSELCMEIQASGENTKSLSEMLINQKSVLSKIEVALNER